MKPEPRLAVEASAWQPDWCVQFSVSFQGPFVVYELLILFKLFL